MLSSPTLENSASLHVHYAANAVTLLHNLKRLVHLLQRLAVRDELVDLQLACHVVIHQVRELGAAFDSSKSTSLYTVLANVNQKNNMEKLTFHTRPVTSWNAGDWLAQIRSQSDMNLRLVEISWPAAATPMTILSPQPLWQASRAARMTPTLPVQSNV